MPLFLFKKRLFKPTLYHLRDIKCYQHLREARKVMEIGIYKIGDAVVLIFNSLLKYIALFSF